MLEGNILYLHLSGWDFVQIKPYWKVVVVKISENFNVIVANNWSGPVPGNPTIA